MFFRFTVLTVTLYLLLSLIAFGQETDSLRMPLEKHFKNVRQLTFGRQNAEAYFSNDEFKLIFQSERDTFQCDQIFSMSTTGEQTTLMSTGTGKTTCSYYLPGDTSFIFASTHLGDPACPPRPDYSKGYVWAIAKTFDIFKSKVGSNKFERMTSTDGYDAEATVSPKGDKIVFTSVRDGDLDIYTMDLDGKNVKRLTSEIGYDGGPFFSWDGTKIVYRANHPKDTAAVAEYQSLLSEGLVHPSKMEIYVMNADGSNQQKITALNGASFAPFFYPGDKKIIFASNFNDPKGRNFDLYMINTDGSGIEQITYYESFDGFPMFTHDGKKIVFASNRHGAVPGETNIFIADWIP